MDRRRIKKAKTMIERETTTEYRGLNFTHMVFVQGQDIHIEDPANGNTASLACALGEGVFSNNDEPLTTDQYNACEEVMDWAVGEGLY